MRGVGSPSITTVVPRKVQLLACSNWAVGESPQGSNFRKPCSRGERLLFCHFYIKPISQKRQKLSPVRRKTGSLE